MQITVNVGDVVESLSGRDKGTAYLVVKTENGTALVTDGRKRKVNNLKTKNVKHLRVLVAQPLNGLAIKIQKGEPVGNERVYRSVRSEKQKLQED